MSFDLTQQCGELCRLVCDREKSESLESGAVETPQVVTLITVSLPSTRDQRCARPEGFRVIDRGVEFDHVRARYDFVQHGQWWWPFCLDFALAFFLLGQRLFDFHFTQTLDQGLHARRAQSFYQLVGWRFVSIRQKDYVTRHRFKFSRVWKVKLCIDCCCRANPDRKSTRLNSSHGYISYAVF